jgi:hypothetical protein
MGRETVEIRIKKDGKVEFTINGVKGSSCEEIHKALATLGKTVKDDKTGEYYEERYDVVKTVEH